MDRLSQLPSDMVFFTQITMEAAEDAAFLENPNHISKNILARGLDAGTVTRSSPSTLPT